MTVKSKPAHVNDPSVEDPNLIVFDPISSDQLTTQMKVTVSTQEVFYEGDYSNIARYKAGSYVVEVRAWADNNFDTGYSQDLQIEIVDECITQSFTIDNSVFKLPPDPTLI